jgi:hypothetical protein
LNPESLVSPAVFPILTAAITERRISTRTRRIIFILSIFAAILPFLLALQCIIIYQFLIIMNIMSKYKPFQGAFTMLYPKNSRPLTDEDFKNPSSEYRATPFWAWNTKLDKEELIRQIGVFKEMGYGGFHMHVRTGMATEYLSDEYMAMIGACVEKARQEKMLSWLYDEDRWPSGFAGGLVTKNKEYRVRHLLFTQRPYGSSGEVHGENISMAKSGRCENGELLACFDVVLDGEGSLLAYE